MAQEVRSILFSADEIQTAVVDLLMQRVRGLSPHQIDRVQVEGSDREVRATVRFCRAINATRVLDSGDLMSAVLTYCRKTRIPLAHRAQKRLGVIGGCLSLTTALNLDAIDPWVIGDAVVHAAAPPALAAAAPP